MKTKTHRIEFKKIVCCLEDLDLDLIWWRDEEWQQWLGRGQKTAETLAPSPEVWPFSRDTSKAHCGECNRQVHKLVILIFLPTIYQLKAFFPIRKKIRSQLEDFLSECNVQLGDGGGDSLVIFHQPHKKKKNKNVLFVGIGCGQSLDVDSFNGLVMGPSPASVLQVSIIVPTVDQNLLIKLQDYVRTSYIRLIFNIGRQKN